MEKYETISINSCNFDGIVEEFNKQDLQEAGVFIDYNQDEEIKVNPNNKKDSNRSKWIKLIFLGILMLLLVIVMCVGHTLIEKQEFLMNVNQNSIQIVEFVKDDLV